MDGIKIEMTDQPVGAAPEPQKPEAKVEPKPEPKYVRLEELEKVNQAINNTREWNTRKISGLEEKIDKLLAATPKPVSTGDPDLDELVQRDWKAGVREVARKEIEDYSKKTQVITIQQQELTELDRNKRTAIEKHPELNDPLSEKSKTFIKVLDENPRWKNYTDGPIIAMREMENRLNLHGSIESGDKMKDTRARATSIPKGTSTNQRGKYSLTAQDIDFCKLNGINPESYKQFKGQTQVEA